MAIELTKVLFRASPDRILQQIWIAFEGFKLSLDASIYECGQQEHPVIHGGL